MPPMTVGRADPALKPATVERVVAERGQRAECIVRDGRPLSVKIPGVQVVASALTIEIEKMRGRRYCASCRRKTYYVITLGGDPFCRHRRCWKCMTDAERAAFRSGY